MTGMIAGGWEFVWSAYGITVAVLGLYIASVLIRFRRESRLRADFRDSDELR